MSCEVLVTPFSQWEYWELRVLGVAMPWMSPLNGLWLEPTLCLTVLRGTTGYSLVLCANTSTQLNSNKKNYENKNGALFCSFIGFKRSSESDLS